jgi:PhnB protein
MSQFEPYLVFNGTCAEAMRFYERALNGKLDSLMTNAQSPMAGQTPAGSENRVMHARLVLDGAVIMASDSRMGMPYEGMKGFAITLNFPNHAAAEKVFNALADGGQVSMPLQKTFWAEAFGMVTDRFGTPWMVNGGQQMP